MTRLLPSGIKAALKQSGIYQRRKAAAAIAEDDRTFASSLATPSADPWRKIADCPIAHLDAGAAQIGARLYVICGFVTADIVSSAIQVFDFEREVWLEPISVPDDLPHSHLGVATDGERYIYIVSGQYGGQCKPAVRTSYCFDVELGEWTRLPDLPQPRYAGTMKLWRGRLHFVGGSNEDRWTPTTSHWSLAVAGAKALEDEWRSEVAFPEGGMHRGSALIDDCLYVCGGQVGDFVAIKDHPDCRCTHRTKETYLSSTYRLCDPDADWEKMADMPIAVSHLDYSTVQLGRHWLALGGQVYKDEAADFRLHLTDTIQAYDPDRDVWSAIGHLPYRVKTQVNAIWDGKLVSVGGQRGRGLTDRAGRVVHDSWIADVSAALPQKRPGRLPSLASKNVLLLSHELQLSGAPIELLELGAEMAASGAMVRVAGLKGDGVAGNPAARYNIPLVPLPDAERIARQSDLVVLNTSSAISRDWFLKAEAGYPDLAGKLLWLIHELNLEKYGEGMEALNRVAGVVFGSDAAGKAWRSAGFSPRNSWDIRPGLDPIIFDAAEAKQHPFERGAGQSGWKPPEHLGREGIRQALGIKEEEILVTSVASISAYKGQELLTQTVARIAQDTGLPLKLALVGFKDLKQRSDFLGTLNRAERKILTPATALLRTPHLSALYAASDMHVLNTQGVGETFGRVTVEAMAFGLPVLATDPGGSAEVIQDGVQGFLYPVGRDGQAVLAERMIELAEDPTLRATMGQAGRQRSRDFSRDVYFDAFEKVFMTLLP